MDVYFFLNLLAIYPDGERVPFSVSCQTSKEKAQEYKNSSAEFLLETFFDDIEGQISTEEEPLITILGADFFE